MVAGPVDKIRRVGAIIQARMSSDRLPGKVLMPLPIDGGKPILKWIIDSLKKSQFCELIIMATSVNPSNDEIVNFCKSNNVAVFRGDEEDVLSRFQHIVKEHNLDVVVRLTGDNPFVDIAILDEAINYHIVNKNQYTKTTGLPLGMNFEIVESKVLLGASNANKKEREHVTLKARRDNTVVKGEFNPLNYNFDHIRLTVDYPIDYLVASQLAAMINTDEGSIYSQIIKICNHYTWLFEINRNQIQKKNYNNIHDELSDAVSILRKLEFPRAADKLELLLGN